MRQNRKIPFKERILQSSRSNTSRIVLAIDVSDGGPRELTYQAIDLLEQIDCPVGKFSRSAIVDVDGENYPAFVGS